LASATQCNPTRPDSLGPFYKPDAPQRISVGSGYRLDGVVRSAATCSPIPGARIELWLAGPDGDYDDDYRATVYASDKGEYRFESHNPPAYYGRPPHIHIRVSAAGFKTLATQHYPSAGSHQGNFNLVLLPLK
jgi:protocatechuate 3,4-dioxygenase beta subunit